MSRRNGVKNSLILIISFFVVLSANAGEIETGLAIAKTYHYNGDLRDAEQTYFDVIKKRSSSETWTELAKFYDATGQYTKALKVTNKIYKDFYDHYYKVVRIKNRAEKAISIANQENSSSKMKNAITSDLERVCSAAIAAEMFRPIDIIKTNKVDNNVVHLSYIREDDNTKWRYLCKLSQNKVLWAVPGGRWRNHPADTFITYELKGEQVIINRKHSDGSQSTKTYKKQ